MAWYDNVKSNIKVDSYSPTDTRTKDAQSEGLELQNQNTQYASQQKRNMDQAFADTMEQKKTIDPVTGAVTYSGYSDPDKFNKRLFELSKQTGVPFSQQDASDYQKYHLGRMSGQTAQAREAVQQGQYGITPESKVNTPTATAGETRKDKAGKTWTFDGKGWYDASQEVGF